MAIAGQRSTSSYSTDFGITAQTFFASLSSVPKTEGPGWISLTDTSYDQVFGPRPNRMPGQTANTLLGYRFTCTIVFDPGSGVSAGDYSYSFDIIVTNVLGTSTIGTVSGTETVTEPPEEPEEPTGDPPSLSTGVISSLELLPGGSAFAPFFVSPPGAAVFKTGGPAWTSITFINTQTAQNRDRYRIDASPGSNVTPDEYFITVTAINRFGSNSGSFLITVANPDAKPAVPSFSITGIPGSSFSETKDFIHNGWEFFQYSVPRRLSNIRYTFTSNNVTVRGTVQSGTITSFYEVEFNRGVSTVKAFGNVIVSPESTGPNTLFWPSRFSGTAEAGSPFSISFYVVGRGPIIYTITSYPSPRFGSLSGSILTGIAPNAVGEYRWTVRATNRVAGTETVITLTVIPRVDPPSWPSPPSGSFIVGTLFNISVSAEGGGTITYGITIGPAFGSISGSSLVGTTPLTPGTYKWEITATNSAGAAFTSATLIATEAASVPSWSSPPSGSASVNEEFSISISASGGGTITYSKTSGPGFGTISGSNLIGTAPSTPGTHQFGISATNSAGTGTTTVTLTVTEEVETPSWPISPSATAQAGASFSIGITASGGGTISYSISGHSSGTLSGASIIGTAPSTTGEYRWTVTATNSAGSNTTTATLTVTEAVQLPSWPSVPSVTSQIDTDFVLNISAQGGGSITYGITGPLFGSLSGENIIGTVPSTTGRYVWVVIATNSAGSNTTQARLIATARIETPSWPTPPSGTVQTGDTFNISITANGGGTITYTKTSGPAFGTISGTTLTGTAPSTAGTHQFGISATNSAGTGTTTVTLTVTETVQIPSWPVPPSGSAVTDSFFSFSIAAVGQGPITYTKTSGDDFATINGTNLEGTAPSFAIIYRFGISATNSAGTGTTTATLTVTREIQVPFWPVEPSGSAVVNTTFNIGITASGGGTITYSISGHESGTLSGTSIIGTAPSETGEITWVVSATNSAGTGTATATLTVTPEPPEEEPKVPEVPEEEGNNPPAWGVLPVPLVTVSAGAERAVSIREYVTGSTTGGAIIITKVDGPDWVTVTVDGLMSIEPPRTTPASDYTVTMHANSVFGGPAEASAVIRVTAPVGPTPTPTVTPSIGSLSDQSVASGQSLSYDISGQVSNDPTSYSISTSPSLPPLTISDSGAISLEEAPRVSSDTVYIVTVTASNSAGTSDPATFNLTIRVPNLPEFDDIPESSLETQSGMTYSIDFSNYIHNYTSIEIIERYTWTSVTGTTLSGTAPATQGVASWTIFVTASNDDGSVTRSYVITVYSNTGPVFFPFADDDQAVDEGDSFRRHFGERVIGAPPITFTFAPDFSTIPNLSWLVTSPNGLINGVSAPFVGADWTSGPITVTATDRFNRSNSIQWTLTIKDTTDRRAPNFTSIPDQTAIRGRLFVLPLDSYLTGDRPINVIQDPDRINHSWLDIQPESSPGGLKVIGTPPRRVTGTITVYLLASNGTIDDRTSFKITIQPISEGAPSWSNIGILRYRENTETIPFNPRIYVIGAAPITIIKKAGSESTWFVRQDDGRFGGTTPTLPNDNSLFQSNTFIAQNARGKREQDFVIEIYRPSATFYWRNNIRNIGLNENDPLRYELSRFAPLSREWPSGATIEYRLTAEQPSNDIQWLNLSLSLTGDLTSPAAPIVSQNERFRVRVEGRYTTSTTWIPTEFDITIFDKAEGAPVWDNIGNINVDENIEWTYDLLQHVTGEPPITIGLTTDKNNPEWLRVTRLGVMTGRNGRTPSVNRSIEFIVYVYASNGIGSVAQTSFTIAVNETGAPSAGPNVNALVTIERNSDTVLRDDIRDLMVNSSTGDLRFVKTAGEARMRITRNGFLVGRTPNINVTEDYDLNLDITDDTGTSSAILRVRVIGQLGQTQPSFITFQIPDITENSRLTFDINKFLRGAQPIVLSIAYDESNLIDDWVEINNGILRGIVPAVFRQTPQNIEIRASNRFGTISTNKTFDIVDSGSLRWDQSITDLRTVNENTLFELDCNDFISGEEPISIIFNRNKFVPSWITNTGGVLSGTPPNIRGTRTHRIYLTAINSFGRLETSFPLKVVDMDQGPSISGIPDIERNEGSLVNINLARYATGEELHFDMNGHPAELSIDRNTGWVQGRLNEVPQTKDYDIKITITDYQDRTDSDTFNLIVNDLEIGAPVWNEIEDIIADEGQGIGRLLSHYLGDSTEFPVEFYKTPGVDSPNWISINIASGLMSGIARDITEETVVYVYVTARNSKGQDSVSIKITIRDIITSEEEPNWNQIQDQDYSEGAPIILPTNPKLIGDGAIGFNLQPTNSEGDVITWQPPHWLRISDDGTGLITGTAPFVDTDTTYTIYLIALNQNRLGEQQSASTSFDINIINISGLRPEIVRVSIPAGPIDGAFPVDIDFNVEVEGVTLDSFDFAGVDMIPHTLYYGDTANSRRSVANENTVARYYSIQFPQPPAGASGVLNVFLKRHSVRIANVEES